MAKIEIIAEIGINHSGDLDKAHYMIEESKRVGVDTVKFQMVNPDLVYKQDDPLYKIFKDVEFSFGDWLSLKRHVEKLGLNFLCTPGEKESADKLKSIGTKRFKVASDSATDVEFVNYLMSLGRPVLVSMGHVDFRAVRDLLDKYDNEPETVFYCISKYPPETKDVDFNILNRLQEKITIGTNLGYSDHFPFIESSLIAVSRGATVIEKHVKCFDTDIDAPCSISFSEFEKMVKSIRVMETLL
jgi:sialic acid synthase SpsE